MDGNSSGEQTAIADPQEAAATIQRQPIFDRNRFVIGYSLPPVLEDPSAMDESGPLSGAAYRDRDLRPVVADRLAFLRATPGMIDGSEPLPAPQFQVVLEVRPADVRRPRALEGLRTLAQRNVGIALANFTPGSFDLDFLALASFAIVDLQDHIDVDHLVEAAHEAGCTLIATGVDDYQDLDDLWLAGVDYVQAPLHRPDHRRQPRRLRAAEVQCIELLRLLDCDEPDAHRISEVVGTDPALAVRLLRMVNSSAFGLRYKVDSLTQAVTLLGPQPLPALVMASLIDSNPKTLDSLWSILARALACQELTGREAAYTVGLFSAVASEIGVEASDLVEQAAASSEVADALSGHSGQLGKALEAVIAYEHNDRAGIAATGYDPTIVALTYIGAVSRALATVASITQGLRPSASA